MFRFSISRSPARTAICIALCTPFAAAAADNPAAANTQNGSAVQQPQVVGLHSGDPTEFVPDSSKVTMQRLSDGTRVYLMNGQGMETLTAHIGADGKLELRCSDAAADAATKAVAEHADDR